jgi:hypothetical protein
MRYVEHIALPQIFHQPKNNGKTYIILPENAIFMYY